MTPTIEQLHLELNVAPKRLAHYSTDELLHVILGILSRPGPLTRRDLDDIKLVNEVFAKREELHCLLERHKLQERAQMN